ncbi:MAG: TIGR00341 family protein [Actinomycetota bacterium]
MRPSITSNRPHWANPATVRGGGFILIGLLILTLPDASTRLLGLLFAGTAVLLGLTDLWTAVRVRPVPWPAVLLGLAMLGAGVAVVVLPGTAFDRLIQIAALVLAARGIPVIVEAIRSRDTSPDSRFYFVKGWLMVVAGLVMIVVPEGLEAALVLSLAAISLVAGAIMISYGLAHDDADRFGTVQLGGFVRRWLSERDVGDEMRLTVIDDLYFEGPDHHQKQVGFWVLLILSTTIATLGILADSTAVVIGAMLVAPLMTPILGVSAGIVNGWMGRVGRSFSTVAIGVAVSILTAVIVSIWAPHFVPVATNSQVVSRVSPTLIDMMIAVAAGAAGAFATVDKRVSSSITGVAIAVALVPPLGVVGVMLNAGSRADATGAFVLFLTNLVSIILAASLVFVLTGFALVTKLRENREKMKTVISTVILGALIIMVPLTFTSEGILSSATRQSAAQEATSKWLDDVDGLRVNRVEVTGDEVRVIVTGEGDLPSVSELNEMLSDAIGVPTEASVELFPSRLFTADD